MPEYPQFLSLKNLIAKRMTMQRFMPSEAIRGKEVIDVTKWMPPCHIWLEKEDYPDGSGIYGKE